MPAGRGTAPRSRNAGAFARLRAREALLAPPPSIPEMSHCEMRSIRSPSVAPANSSGRAIIKRDTSNHPSAPGHRRSANSSSPQQAKNWPGFVSPTLTMKVGSGRIMHGTPAAVPSLPAPRAVSTPLYRRSAAATTAMQGPSVQSGAANARSGASPRPLPPRSPWSCACDPKLSVRNTVAPSRDAPQSGAGSGGFSASFRSRSSRIASSKEPNSCR